MAVLRTTALRTTSLRTTFRRTCQSHGASNHSSVACCRHDDHPASADRQCVFRFLQHLRPAQQTTQRECAGLWAVDQWFPGYAESGEDMGLVE